MSEPLKIAIVGCGQFAESHVQEIKKIPLADLVALCDLEKLMGEQLAERYEVPQYYDDINELLQTARPDVLHITTPPHSHHGLATMALNAGCHVYVEKPFALNLEQTDEILKLSEKTGKKVTVGHSYYFDPIALEMRSLIEKGILGDLVHIESFYGYNLSGPFGAGIMGNRDHWVHKLPGKLFHNNIDHLINKIVEHIPDPEPQIMATGFNARPELFGDIRDEMFDELRVMINGKKMTSYATFSSHTQPVGHFARLYGSKNSIHVDYNARTIILEERQKYPSALGRLIPPFKLGFQYLRAGRKNINCFLKNNFHFFAGMSMLMTLFYESIINDMPCPIPYENIRRVAAFNQKIFEQINQGKAK
jgi:predicted dehydrogenase